MERTKPETKTVRVAVGAEQALEIFAHGLTHVDGSEYYVADITTVPEHSPYSVDVELVAVGEINQEPLLNYNGQPIDTIG